MPSLSINNIHAIFYLKYVGVSSGKVSATLYNFGPNTVYFKVGTSSYSSLARGGSKSISSTNGQALTVARDSSGGGGYRTTLSTPTTRTSSWAHKTACRRCA